MSNFGNTWIIVHLKHTTRHLILCHQILLDFFRINTHRTEFIKLEDTSIFSHTILSKNSWSSIFTNKRIKEDSNNTTEHQTNYSSTDIEEAFRQDISIAIKMRRKRNNFERTQLLDTFFTLTHKFKGIQINGYWDSHKFKWWRIIPNLVLLTWQINQNLVYYWVCRIFNQIFRFNTLDKRISEIRIIQDTNGCNPTIHIVLHTR